MSIEELQDFLHRHGVPFGLAEEIHDAYYHGDVEGVRGYDQDLIDLVLQWRRESGEDRGAE